ncbi:MAG: ThiF family adenylyltransferase [Desulfobacterium sp.]|nr:ThiF family adenylyltransferase [Desulfobacterium sp.]
MKIMILDKIADQLKTMTQAVLYGVTNRYALAISSLKPAPGLDRIGVFFSMVEGSEDQELVFSFSKAGLIQAFLDNEEYPVEIMSYATDFNKRNKGLVDESVLQKVVVTIIGLGSGGSSIVLDLIRCGVTHLTLIEFDTVSLSNLCRSVYTLADVGRKKTEAILDKALSINPCVRLTLIDEDVLEMDIEKLEEIIGQSDLIIEATDSPQTKILINGRACHSTPVIYPAVYEEGKGGDIFFSFPGFPCYECVFHSVIKHMLENTDLEWDYTTGQAKPMPALIADIQVVCARTVKLALAILTGDQENSFLSKVIKPGCTLLLIGNEKGVSVFPEAFGEAWVETHIDPECSCQTLE